MKKYLLYMLGFFLIYSFGVISFRNNLEPIKSLKKFKNQMSIKLKIDNSSFYNRIVDKETTYFKSIFDTINPAVIRNKILDKLIVKDFEISRQKTNYDCFGSVEILETEFYQIKNRGVYTNKDKKKLFIYFQGHGGNPCNFSYFKNLYSELDDFDFLSFSMFGLGMNEMEKIGFPIKLSSGNLYNFYNDQYSGFIPPHDIIQFFYDENRPELKPLSLFISSPYLIINQVLESKKYDEIVISGISGGGWYSTILSGLIPEINQLYSFNGTLPLVYRIGTNSKGDYEDQFSELWDTHDYYKFYFLSTYDNNNIRNRLSYHLYSKMDECCFSSPEINYFEKTIKDLNISNIKIKIFDKVEHEIDDKWLIEQLSN